MKIRLLVILIPLLGLIFGYILRKIAPDEAEQGKKYFFRGRQLILFMLMLTLLWITPITFPMSIAFVVGIISAKLLRLRYLYLGIAAVATFTASHEQALLIAALLFLYGLPFGTQMIKKDPRPALAKHAVLYLLPFILLTTPFSSSPLLSAFTAGTLFLRE